MMTLTLYILTIWFVLNLLPNCYYYGVCSPSCTLLVVRLFVDVVYCTPDGVSVVVDGCISSAGWLDGRLEILPHTTTLAWISPRCDVPHCLTVRVRFPFLLVTGGLDVQVGSPLTYSTPLRLPPALFYLPATCCLDLPPLPPAVCCNFCSALPPHY